MSCLCAASATGTRSPHGFECGFVASCSAGLTTTLMPMQSEPWLLLQRPAANVCVSTSYGTRKQCQGQAYLALELGDASSLLALGVTQLCKLQLSSLRVGWYTVRPQRWSILAHQEHIPWLGLLALRGLLCLRRSCA